MNEPEWIGDYELPHFKHPFGKGPFLVHKDFLPGLSKCKTCGSTLVFSARQRGDELCGPCHRLATGKETLAQQIEQEIDLFLCDVCWLLNDFAAELKLDTRVWAKRKDGKTTWMRGPERIVYKWSGEK